MFFRQVLYRDLGCASYMLGDAGEAVVIDPRFDIDVYLEIARTEHLQIRHVVDTHDHADHVSGRFRVARATGARCRRASAGDDSREDSIVPGEEIAIGSVRVLALATGGHRPEHLSFAVTDLSRGSDPWLLLTGDSLLVGDLARPDLVLHAEEGATRLHASLRPMLALGDHVEVWPAHVGGSLCGGAQLSAKTSSTIGFERLHNPLLLLEEAEFVRGLVEGILARPPNVERIVSLNHASSGQEPTNPQPLEPGELIDALRSGVTVLDGRPPPDFDAGHLAGAINLPAESAGIGTRAGWVMQPDEPIVIVACKPDTARTVASALHAVGLWETVGYALAETRAWDHHGLPVAEAASWDLDRLAGSLRQGAVDLVDVRDTSEWIAGHVPGSHHIPLHGFHVGRPVDLPNRGHTTAVACTAGIRAAFAASLLRRAGRPDVVRVAGGGIDDLEAHGIALAVGAA